MREITLEMEALRDRVGNGQMPESVTIRVEFDREKGGPRLVEVDEHWRRRILGAEIATRPAVIGARRRG